MNNAETRLPLLLVVWFLAVWTLASGSLLWQIPDVSPFIRCAIILGATVLLIQISSRTNGYYFLSPLFLLGFITLVFYSVGPSLYGIVFPDPISYFGMKTSRTSHDHAIAFVGSNAEILILQFSAFCFLILSALLTWSLRVQTPPREQAADHGSPRHLLGLLHFMVLALAMLFLISGWTSIGQAFFFAGLGSEIRHALAPLMSISMTALAYFSAHDKRSLKLVGGLLMTLALTAMIVSGLAATAVYIFMVAAMLFLLRLNLKPKTLLAVIGTTMLILPAAILGTVIPRGEIKNTESVSAIAEYAAAKLTSKLIFRQTTSGYCLNGIYEKYRSTESTNPLFFTMAIIPRAIWPEKPILSRGSEYAEYYCNQGGAIRRQHSESITLLGEPLLNGGIVGIITAQLVLAAFLGIATILGASGQPAQIIFMVALLPWLATFEQHFAEYFGNLVKVLIIMLPIFVCLKLLLWRHRNAKT
ncbi:MAG: hypothetical protein GKS01_05855 [Alphaproteobacteria bacterium]|nr:hypothetical protein [Alphaproteobacteria bacterium]